MSMPAVALAMMAVLNACAASRVGAAGDTLTDASIVEFARKPYDKAVMMNRTVPLGRHHGADVVADFPCSDVCPNYTTRIIHYQLGRDQTCQDVDGAMVDRTVPIGIAVSIEKFCVPAALEAAHLQ